MRDKTLHFICEKGKDHFAQPIINAINLTVIKRVGSNDLSHLIHSVGAKNIWVEWASHPAIMVSKIKRPWQKLIIRLHRYEMYRKKWMHKINWGNVDYVIFVNSELEKEFKKTINNSVKTLTIPNAIEIDTFSLNELSNINSILAYGLHFHPVKAYDKLIELFAKVTNQNPNFSLTIACQKPTHQLYQKCFDECNKLIAKFDLSDKVELVELNIGGDELKTHSNIKLLLNSHNAIISYSNTESFHYAFAEGLLCGLQGFCRGWRELNPYEFWNDWCYDSEKSMIEGILDWGETTIGKRQQIAKTNRKYILDNFSSNVIGNKYNNLINNLNFNSSNYWENRYAKGGNSGSGSYGNLEIFKTETINHILEKYNLCSVIELGCGDGNQLKNIDYKNYKGFDISKTAINLCKKKYYNNKNLSFELTKNYNGETSNLTLSLDVIFHLTEENVFNNYMKLLFNASEQFVLIYSSNTDIQIDEEVKHFKNRIFTDWVTINFKKFELIEKIPNKYPYNRKLNTGSVSDFYLFKKK